MSVITFERVIERQKIKGICEKCHKKCSRTLVSEMTVNPFNKNIDGTVRNRKEVYDAVIEKLEEMVEVLSKKFICSSCKSNLVWGNNEGYI